MEEPTTPAPMTPQRLAARLPRFRRYSGRGMYGRECPATEVRDLEETLELGGVLNRLDPWDEHGLLAGAALDSMGLGQIVYWPRLLYPEGEGIQ